jgi:hypothetical protein
MLGPDDPPPFFLEGGDLGPVGEVGLPIEANMSVIWFARGLKPRLERAMAEEDTTRAWNEVRDTAVLGLLYYRAHGYVIYRLIGIAVLRAAAREALKHDIPQVQEHRELFSGVHEVCKAERIEAESLFRARQGRLAYLRLGNPDPDKVVYDVVTQLARAEELGGHPIAGETFVHAVTLAAMADVPRAWDALFASIDRFRGSRNTAIRRTVADFFDRHDRQLIERVLRNHFH